MASSSAESVSSVRSDEGRTTDEQLLTYASDEGDLAAVQRALGKGADVNCGAPGNENWTPLHFACCFNGHLDVIRVLLDAGANPEAKADDETTPLYWACKKGHLEAARILLLEAGVNINAQVKAGWTALHIAACEGHWDVVKVLLDAGAEIDAVDQPWYNASLFCLQLRENLKLSKNCSSGEPSFSKRTTTTKPLSTGLTRTASSPWSTIFRSTTKSLL